MTQLSPGIRITEQDFTSIVPAVSTSVGAFVGHFKWGPVEQPTTISSESELLSTFNRPDDNNFNSFFSAANFLSYSSNLLCVRADANNQNNAVSSLSLVITEIGLASGGTGYDKSSPPNVVISPPANGMQAYAEAIVSDAGVVTSINITDPGENYMSGFTVTIDAPESGTPAVIGDLATSRRSIKIKNSEHYLQNYINGNDYHGPFAARYPGALGNSLKVVMVDRTSWDMLADQYKSQFSGAPGTSDLVDSTEVGLDDEVHILVIDEDGLFTGVRGTILEKYEYASKYKLSRRADGTNNYYAAVINSRSNYIYWLNKPTDVVINWDDEAAPNVVFTPISVPVESSLIGGSDVDRLTSSDVIDGWNLLKNEENEISLGITGNFGSIVDNHVIDMAEDRMDFVAFISPSDESSGTPEVIFSNHKDKVIEYRNSIKSSSYAMMDSGYKYQYDKFNDTYRYITLNADIAGLCARTDYTDETWFSPAGQTRGQVRGVVKLSYNPDKTDRDEIYQVGINPVISLPGQGVILYGDKTLQNRASAFDRINVRRLFIVMEKAIARAADGQLFEQNDEFTRNRFKNIINPYLRDIQGRRGVEDYRVVCDATNNTPAVVDSNRFVADIYVKPTRSINFINLNFIAVRSGVSFSEIVR